MWRSSGWAGLLVLGMVATAAASGPAHRWAISPEHSAVWVEVLRAGAFSPVLHDHRFEATAFAGTFVFDPAVPERLSGQVKVEAASLRETQSALSERERQQVEQQALGPRGLDAQAFPEIVLTAFAFQPSGRKDGALSGSVLADLTLKGQTNRLRIPVRAQPAADGAWQVSGDFSFRQSRFGLRPYRRLFGAVAVQDPVRVSFRLLARAVPAPAQGGARAPP